MWYIPAGGLRSRRPGKGRLFGLAAAVLGVALAAALLVSHGRQGPPAEAGAAHEPADRAEAGAGRVGEPAAAATDVPPGRLQADRARGTPPDAAPGAAQPLPIPRPGTMERPVAGAVIARHGWVYSSTMEDWRWHPGVDIAAPAGTAVKAAAAGRVQSVRQGKEWGWEVTIDHGGGVASRYAGCREVSVSPGQQVGAGEAVAAVGESALAEVENGAHLHFEVLVDGKPVDPMRYLK